MMPLFDISYLVQQQRQAAVPHEVPLSTLAGGPLMRSMEEQSNPARDQYYQLQRDPPRKPCDFGAHKLRGSGGDINSKVDFDDEDAPKGNDNAVRDDNDYVFYTLNKCFASYAKYDNYIEQFFFIIDRVGERTTIQVYYDDYDYEFSFSNKDDWEILIWQDGAGSLSYLGGKSNLKDQRRIEDLLKDMPKAKRGTPMAAVADDVSAAHLFYLDENNVVSHIFMSPRGTWKRGGLSTVDKRIPAHRKSMLSAAFHRGEHDTNIVILSYQDPNGNLQLTMSENTKNGDDWYTVDFGSFTGRHRVGGRGGTGHAIAGDWQNKKQDPDGSFSGLLMAVEESEELTPWECSMDFHASSKKQVECHLLDKIFLDSNGKGLSISSRTGQLAWTRTGHGENEDPAQTLPYEFALLYIDSEGSIRENRVGIDIPRIAGPGFNVDMSFDSFATNGNKTVYAKSGSDVVVFRLDADGWQWKVDGIVNTTFSEIDS